MFVGRKKEKEILRSAVRDEMSRFIAIYGRRRVGKTFLVREAYGGRFTFSHAGLYEGSRKEQLFAFSSSLKEAGLEISKMPRNWMEAFELLKDLIRNSKEKKKVLFIDELSWMDSPKSDLLLSLENFWNGFASARDDVILIVCASATSWMMSKIVHNKGGLYNRLTDQINLQTFSLGECEEYVKEKGLALTRNQIMQFYMIFGGVPFYWGFLQKGMSLSQNIDSILFAKDAPLKDEFKYLYASVFKNPAVYIKIIETLAVKKVGMTREEIIHASGIRNSGDLTVKLSELESCGFIRSYHSFGMKSKNKVYQLVDFFTLFYYRFMEEEPTDEHFWTNQVNMPVTNTWKGFAFERVCLRHVDQIKSKLGISGVLTDVNAWYCKADYDKGVMGSQIDMLIARRDQVINLCEMKYSDIEFMTTEKISQEMRRKMHDFRTVTGTKYAIFPTLITVYGVLENSYSDLWQSIVTMDDLFC